MIVGAFFSRELFDSRFILLMTWILCIIYVIVFRLIIRQAPPNKFLFSHKNISLLFIKNNVPEDRYTNGSYFFSNIKGHTL